MKKVFWLLVFVCGLSFGQETLVLKPIGFDAVVTNVENKSVNDIYVKTKEWIQTYYKNPKEVLKAVVENDMVRIQGFASGGYKMKSLGVIIPYDFDYTIEISFKDGKYRYNFQIYQLWAGGKKCMYSYSDFFKKDGSQRTVYQLANETMTATVNENYLSLYEYIIGKTKKEKSNW